MTYDPMQDRRLDPRTRALLAGLDGPLLSQAVEAESRQAAIDLANSDAAIAAETQMLEGMEIMDDEAQFPSRGLRIIRDQVTSSPDGNSVPLKIVRPDTDDVLPTVLYIHGGAMATMSFEFATYRAWSKALAHQQLCVVMVDFRNSLRPSSSGEIAPFPAGLNDCVSAYRWTQENIAQLGGSAEDIIVAGDSGGGNLAIATVMKLCKEFDAKPLGLYALCPYILGSWPNPDYPSSIENEGVLISVANNHATMAYGIEALNARDPLAWPAFASVDDVRDFPPTMVSINECDPLRDEGLAFYRLLLEAGVTAHCRQLMGTVHANEMFTALTPDLTRMTARDIRSWISECKLLRRS